jgi:hypothetical protein
VYVGKVLVGGRVNVGDAGNSMWLMDFIYLFEIEQKTSYNCLEYGRERVEGERRWEQ